MHFLGEEIMKRIEMPLAWLMAFLLVSANVGIQGCGAKESSHAAASQQDSPSAAAAPATNASSSAPVPAQQADQGQQQQPQAGLPPVNLTPDGLDELMAPVALYPDPVLAVMMQASVDPQQVMDGGNWLALDQNNNLKDAALDQASEKAGFTPIMQALLHYATVVDMMCTQFDWTKQLGAAYEANPKAVLASVQRLRAQAVDNGALKSSSQMKVDVTQDNGQQVVELKPTDPKVVYVPQYNPDQVFQTTTTTTKPDGTVITTTTGPAPATTTSTNTTVVQQQSGVSTGSAVLIGLLSFGAGIAVGAAINNNNYYYPAWGYGGVYYGGRPYYPPPYRPVYYPGYGGGYHYNRPVHYGNNNIYINSNNNYYKRFNNNNNLNPNYKPRPVPYNNKPGSTYSRNMGSQPGNRQGANYRPGSASAGARPANGNIQNRPGARDNPGTAQRPANGSNANNWKGQTTYQGNKAGNNNQARPATQPGNASANNRIGAGNTGANNRVGGGNATARNPSGDRGYGQNSGSRPNTTAQRPVNANKPAGRPAQQPQARPQPSNGGGAFGGVSNAKADRAASNRGKASMGAPQTHHAQPRQSNAGTRKR
jgi:Protein of unknown function (DUF3300)